MICGVFLPMLLFLSFSWCEYVPFLLCKSQIVVDFWEELPKKLLFKFFKNPVNLIVTNRMNLLNFILLINVLQFFSYLQLYFLYSRVLPISRFETVLCIAASLKRLYFLSPFVT